MSVTCSHICVKYIYIYQSSDNDPDISWTAKFEKIRGVWSSIDHIKEKILQDIQSYTTRPSRWVRSQEIFLELWRQSSSKSPSNIELFHREKTTVDFVIPHIVLLFCNNYRSFHLSHDMMKIDEFSDVKGCSDFIQRNGTMSTIFLIICISSVDFCGEVRPLMEFDSVHATYIFANGNILERLQTMPIYDSMKLSGVFSNYDDILLQLTKDICFYREISSHIPKMTTLRTDINSIDLLGKQEIDFVRFQLFIDILQHACPIINSRLELRAYIDTDQINSLFCSLVKNAQFCQIINELFEQRDILTLLEASSLLKYIDQRLATLKIKNDTFPSTIYRAHLFRKEDLVMIRNNINSMITMHIIMLFSRSLSSVTNICRRAVDNGLTVALFEIHVSEKTTLSQIDSDIFAFRIGSVFRIVAIDEMLDGIWHIQLELIDCAVQHIKEQIKFDIDKHATWLTFGNYLTALNQFQEAKVYYEYLLRSAPVGDSIRSPIYNNMGLMYSAMNNEDEAINLFKKALETFVEEVSVETEEDDCYLLEEQFNSDLEFHRATLYGKIAEGYDRQKDYTKALAYYRKALEVTPDSRSSLFYQAKINSSLKNHENYE